MVYHPPAPLQIALADLRSILASPSVVLLSETSRHADIMAGVLEASSAAGNLVHDAHIAALCLEHGVSELLTGNRDRLASVGPGVPDRRGFCGVLAPHARWRSRTVPGPALARSDSEGSRGG